MSVKFNVNRGDTVVALRTLSLANSLCLTLLKGILVASSTYRFLA